MKAFSTWHDDLREAHLASHSGGAVHQVREVLPYLMDVSRQQLQSHPQACWCIQGEEEEDVRASHCLSHQTAPGQDTDSCTLGSDKGSRRDVCFPSARMKNAGKKQKKKIFNYITDADARLESIIPFVQGHVTLSSRRTSVVVLCLQK